MPWRPRAKIETGSRALGPRLYLEALAALAALAAEPLTQGSRPPRRSRSRSNKPFLSCRMAMQRLLTAQWHSDGSLTFAASCITSVSGPDPRTGALAIRDVVHG